MSEVEKASRPNLRRAGDAARRLRRELGVDHPTDLALELVAHHRGLTIERRPLVGAAATLVRVGDRGKITISDALGHHAQRWTIAHELCHFDVHPELGFFEHCETDVDARDTVDKDAEREADAFSAEYLLPRQRLLPLCEDAPARWEIVDEVAQTFDVSLTAAALRFVNLSNRRVAFAVFRGDSLVWCKKPFRFRHYIKPTCERPKSHRAERMNARAWLESDGAVTAHTFEMPRRYGTTLVLLDYEEG